ncbi:hypothetical protein ACU4GD_38800 [Cupriavidus basilensis]
MNPKTLVALAHHPIADRDDGNQGRRASLSARQPIRIVVPYAAGGMTDVVARVIGLRLGERPWPGCGGGKPAGGSHASSARSRSQEPAPMATRCWRPPIPR